MVMKLTIKNKLLIGFGSILLIVAISSINSIIQMEKVGDVQNRLTNLRMPTVLAGTELTDGIHLSLAGLRGYIILGANPLAAEKFKAERLDGWKTIDDSISKMDQFSKNWTNPENINMLNQVKTLAEEFRLAQQEIEEISHSPENVPALKILLFEAAPRATKIITEISTIINEESNLEATEDRKKLLKLLADSRGSFALGLANIRAYLLSGNTQFADKFQQQWAINQTRFTQVSNLSHLFNQKQSRSWSNYKRLRNEFTPLPLKMFELRRAENWNLANYWLGTKAAPKANAILTILEKMRLSQDLLSIKDTTLLKSKTTSMEVALLIAMAIILILGIAIALYMSNLITTPLNAVVTRARAIAKGDLTGSDLISKSNDELTELTDAINQMKDSLCDIIQQVSGSVQSINESSKQLTVVTEESNRSLNDQQTQTTQLTSSMNEMTSSVQEVSTNISDTASAAQKADIETKEGNQMVESTIDAIQQLAGGISGAAKAINQLEKDSSEIGSVLDVIKGVADQTNLLALNAAIEAARAGEHGRGFAVVADEVRTLAGRTQKSTEEIVEIINKLQSGTRQAKQIMAQSSEEASSVVEKAEKAGGSLVTISEAVTQINNMSTQIASSSKQQSHMANDINESVTGISEMGNQTMLGSDKTTRACKDLLLLASDLNELVNKFKL